MTDKCYECGGPVPEGWEMCAVCSVRAKLPDRPDLPPPLDPPAEGPPAGNELFVPADEVMTITVPPTVEQHEAPGELLRGIHMIHRNGQLVQPGEHNDYILDMKSEPPQVVWNVPLEEWETVCVFCPTTGSRWAWSPQCGVFVDIRRKQ